MQACADRSFYRKSGDHWFTGAVQASYERLVYATQFHSVYHRKFLISHDQDRRHSMLHYPATVSGKRGKPFDRRTVAGGGSLQIPVDIQKDYIPTAPRVPDCIQCPIEMYFAPIKVYFRKLLAQQRRAGQQSSFQLVAQLAEQAFNEKGGIERAGSCWQHAVEKALRIFATPYRTWITIDGERVMGVGGNWVPGKYRG